MMSIQRRFAMLAGTSSAALLVAAGALAQTATPDAAQAVQQSGPTTVSADAVAEVVVTGSRIRGAAPVGSPVISLDRKALETSGAVTTDRIIKEIPQVFDLGTSENSRGQSGGSNNITYGNAINIRGIGPYATLTIIDGHRAVDNSRSVDPSVIPSLGLERVEVVADGASAVYGSDAVAGVVNLIPRRSLDGVDAIARMGVADDFHESQFGVAAGKVWSGGQVMVAYEHVFRSNLSGNDRSFFTSDQRSQGGSDYRSNQCAPGNIVVGGVSYAIPQGGVSAANAGALVAGTSNRCEGFTNQDLFPQTKYDSVNETVTLHLAHWLDFFSDGYYSKRSFLRNAGNARTTVTVPATNAFFVRPTGTTGAETVQLLFPDLPVAQNLGYTRTWEGTGGLRAKLGSWQLSGQVSYGKGHDESDTYQGFNNGALAAALASSNPATAVDPYGLGRTSPSVLQGIYNAIFLAPTLTRVLDAQGSVNGTLFDLPGGAVKLAVGYEHYDEHYALGSARGVPTTPLTYRHFVRRVDSEYAEAHIPVFGPENAVAGLQKLEIAAAVRHDQYSDVGKTTNPKIGVNWSPIRNLTIRGSYGTSFRAPLISQIYGNSSNFFVQPYSDPTQGGAIVQGVALSGGNTNLKPEKAKTWSAGFDWNPRSDIHLSATFWNVDYSNQVNTYLSDLAVLSKEAQLAGSGVILRGAEAAARVAQLQAQGIAVASGVLPSPVTLFIDGRTQNLDRSLTSGIDLLASYTVDAGHAGRFTLNANATYLTRYKVALSGEATPTSRLNTVFNPLKFKSRASLNWDIDGVDAHIVVTHVGGYKNNTLPGGAIQNVSSYTPVDLGVTFTIGDRASRNILTSGFALSFDVYNVANVDPPYLNFAPTLNGSGGYDASASNPLGREFAVTLRKHF